MRQTTNCATVVAPLVGRQAALAETKALLARTRLLTLTGPGGCGKTCLALQIASDMRRAHADGVWVIELDSLFEPALAPAVVASALGLQDAAAAPADSLLAFLQRRNALLVFDNCEHLLPTCVALIEALVRACPGVRILATSREALNSALEVVWPVPPLSLPDTQSLAHPQGVGSCAAIQLFVQRAAAVVPAFSLDERNAPLIERICRRLDGLPLAIELAASCMKALAPEQIAAQLEQGFHLLTHGHRTAPPRQQTLEATMDWSYHLLTAGEQALFRRVSVLAATFELSAATAVDGGSPEAALEQLRRLIDKSLVVVAHREGEARYRVLETLRQYGRQQLRRVGEEHDTYVRYCAWISQRVGAAAPTRGGSEHALWLDRCELEIEQARAGLRWMLDHHQIEPALILATSLQAFWRQRGRIGEGRHWLETTLALDPTPAVVAPLVRARALNALGVLLMWQCAYPDAQARHDEALAIFTALDHQPGIAWTEFRLGFLADRRADYHTATRRLERSLQLFAALGDRPGADAARSRLGITAWNLGEYKTATRYLEQSLRFQREQRDPGACAATLLNLGAIALERGDAKQATALLEESLALNRGLNDRLALAYTYTYLGYSALRRREPRSAEPAFDEALAILDPESNPELVFRLLDGCAMLAAQRGRSVRAARLWGAMESFRAAQGLEYRPIERQLYDREIAAARCAVDPPAFDRAWAEGRAMSLADVLSESEADGATPGNEAAAEDMAGDASPAAAQLAAPDRRNIRAPIKRAPAGDPDEPGEPRLRLFALGPVRVYRSERLLTTTDLTYTKARELLFFLLGHAPSAKEQIGLALWPDASPDYLRATFRVIIYHLRRALGPERWIVREHHYYRFNQSLAYWYDVEAFETAAHQANGIRGSASDKELASLQAAISLYQGDFWEGVTAGDWIALERERLQRMYLEALLALGELYRTRGTLRLALETFLRATERDAYCEEAHRGAIRCYLQLHEPGQAMQHFQRLRRDLREQLGLAPAAETAALLRAHA